MLMSRQIESIQLFADKQDSDFHYYRLYTNKIYGDGFGSSSLSFETFEASKLLKSINWYIRTYKLPILSEDQMVKLDRWLKHPELASVKIDFKSSKPEIRIFCYLS